MKGVSLAIETIIVLIISLTVFTAMTFFFNVQFGKGQTTVELLNGQREWCSAYIRQDSKCSQEGYNAIYNAIKSSKKEENILKRINYYCGNLPGYKNCRCTPNDPDKCTPATKECVFECCSGLYCPAGTSPQQTKK